jgi:AcrR family transcriptional regulator
MKSTECSDARGRPRGFCVDQALERALHVFWRKGYEGTSLSDLTQAMGINRPSLYAAYGNKETLFRKALDRYAQGGDAFFGRSLAQPTARAVAEHLLLSAADALTCPENPSGCFMVRCALSTGDAGDAIRQELVKRRAHLETMLRRRLQRAKTEGDLPAPAQPADLARYMMTVHQGMSVQAAGGANRAQLRRVARTALNAWPQ